MGAVLMTPAVAVTDAERVADTCHRLGYLIDRHSLPAPTELRVRAFGGGPPRADAGLRNLHDLNLWAEATDAAVVKTPHDHGKWLHVACSVLGDVPLRLTAFGKALTP
jgi:hypothetical protein